MMEKFNFKGGGIITFIHVNTNEAYADHILAHRASSSGTFLSGFITLLP
jgi:hypothetical protein